ncbi:hypothetical protein SAMN00768000_3731 [Sulfobacillus thermosulfidooxidans DSM 9293]|uniref:Uncharacterized protein n=1 Tax=Sulfobacillus thermosulfidooxidans (strain DSM 9293 / VKM B-1269 / AT-1) TaxID=929705 RepID=A0A1W1WPR1_SULTA|nr:hypothetical protein [Sulfobacillus thermosulfidooxidans]SMC08192.1 hypothetical protein SAMN00768000_3731 [Sulfobacillus thermosulfidooxidans DSM 9293]
MHLPEPLSQKLQDLETALQSTYHAHLEDLAQTFVDTTQQWQADLHAMHDDLTRLKALDAERDHLLADLTVRLTRLQALEQVPNKPSSEDFSPITPSTPSSAPSEDVQLRTTESTLSAVHPPMTPPTEPQGSPTLPGASGVSDGPSVRHPDTADLNDPVLPKLVQNF